ncbi:MAG: hypothetical protein ACPG5W_03045, partial [Flavobacteriales bacterium]
GLFICQKAASMTLRTEDNKSERAVAEFLDENFYPNAVENMQRIGDAEMQIKGVDVLLDLEDVKEVSVDEKAAAHFVNKNIPTFAFELDFIGRDGLLKQGWLADKEKLTQYYLLSWVWAKKDRGFAASDITKLEVVLIEREKILKLLEEHSVDAGRLMRIAKHLREMGLFGAHFKKRGRPFYFNLTEHLTEQPINVIIHKRSLIELAKIHQFVRPNGNTD